MTLKAEDRIWIAKEIKAATDPLRPHGWKKVIYWSRDIGGLGLVIGAFVALLAVTLTAVHYEFAEVRDEVEFRAHTSDRLKTIEATLSLLQAQGVVDKYSSLTPHELTKHRAELKEVKDTLARVPENTPNFWSTSFQIIQLASQSISGLEPSGQSQIHLDNVSGIIAGKTVTYAPGTRIFLKNAIRNSIFRDSIITFDPDVQLMNVTFINCVLILPSESNPPQNLQNLGKALLASDLSTITISAS